jgi:hypothetical protein
MIINQSKIAIEQKIAKAAKVVAQAFFSRLCVASVKSHLPDKNEEQCKNNVVNLAHHQKTVEITGVFCELRGVPAGTLRHTTCGTARQPSTYSTSSPHASSGQGGQASQLG